jgi:hypothetical protein
MFKINENEKGQAVAPKTKMMKEEVFQNNNSTEIYWLGSAGIMIHSHATNIMVDPVLEGFDIPLLYDVPIQSNELTI